MQSTVLKDIFTNRIILASIGGWALAQAIKIFLGILREKHFDFRWLVETGGLPSAHASGVCALAVAVGLNTGFNSALFAVSCVLALVTMFDAQTVRRSVGEQAEILNRMLDDLYWRKKIGDDKIREFWGHTPTEVLMGAILGILAGIIVGI